MVKAILEFDLSEEEDRIAHLRACQALELALALNDISERVRATDKYDAKPMTREEFYDILSNRDINLSSILR